VVTSEVDDGGGANVIGDETVPQPAAIPANSMTVRKIYSYEARQSFEHTTS